jgi:hypothetical protein
MQVIVHSNKDRYRCMAQTNSHTVIEVPCWMGCKHGHSIKSVGPMGTPLILTDQGNFETIRMVGQVAHKTNNEAMAGILSMGLRNDATGNYGRKSVMADPFGPTDVCKNMTIQSGRGSVHVVVGMQPWWEAIGSRHLRRKQTGVRAFITGAGPVLFANANPYIAMVIPTRVLAAILMHHPISDHFSRQMRASGGPDPEVYGANLDAVQNWVV